MNNPPLAFDQPAQALRGASRTNLYLSATLIGRQSRLAVTVRNLSATGALVRGAQPLQELGAVCLVRGELRAPAQMAWADGCNGGINFDEPIDLVAWAPRAANAGQMAIDRTLADSRLRGSGAEVRGAPPRDATDQAHLLKRIAEELAFASRRLEGLGSDLADDPFVVRRHAAQLQQIDITMQTLAHLGRLLASDRPDAVLASIGIEDLRRRLERAPIA